MAKAGQPKSPANPLTTRWEQWLFAPKDAHGLAIFRIGFGLVMLWEMGYFAYLDFPETFIHTPQVNLKYPLLEFVQPLSSGGLWLVIATLMACGVLIALGKFYRWAMGGFCVGFTYLFLLDTAYYNNHLYLICLLAFLLFFCRADAALTIDKAQAAKGSKVPAWNYWVLRGQLFIVYFFGGVAKLNADWLVHLEPVHTMLAYKAKAAPGMAGLLHHEGMAYFIAYGGVAFDLIIGFLLLYRPTRKIGFAGALVFNGMNAWIFDDINIFPYFMILALVLFADPAWTRAQVEKVWRPGTKGKGTLVVPKAAKRQQLFRLLIAYFVVQALLPLRHWLFPGNADWNGHAQRFSWRMKIQHRKLDTIAFNLYQLENRTHHRVNLISYGLNRDQITTMTHDPEMARQFAQFLAEDSRTRLGMRQVMVKAYIRVGFNGRPAQHPFSPDLDLLKVPPSPFRPRDWILPLDAPNL